MNIKLLVMFQKLLIFRNYNSVLIQANVNVVRCTSIESSLCECKKYLVIPVILLFIVFCDPAITCNGKGVCTIDGTCNCETMFYGETCLSKLRKNCDIFLIHHKTNIFYFKLFHSCLSLSLYM